MSDDVKPKSKALLRTLFAAALVATSLSPLARTPALAQQPSTAKPNILVIFGDDVGQSNISVYTRGLVGYKTPNIDRIANEGMMFTDYYAENSCTAGRSTFITGQVCLRTGLSVGPAPRSNPALPLGNLPPRRLFWKPLPSQCRGGARAALLSQE